MQSQNPKQFFASLKIIHFALLAGQILFLLVVLYLNLSKIMNIETKINNDNIFLIIASVITIGAFLGGKLLENMQLTSIRQKTNLTEKIKNYLPVQIVKFALLEGASFFSLVASLLTSNYIFASISALIIFYFFIIRPTRIKLISDLELNRNEVNEI